jgi:hypothetical protein
MEIEIVNIDDLIDFDWTSTHILRPDLLVLANSIGSYGLLSPIVVQRGTNKIIDGSQRVRLIKGNAHLADKFSNGIAITYVDCSEMEAMIIHVQMNRGRGSIVAKKLSRIVRTLSKTGKLDEEGFVSRFCMKFHELELMLDGTLLVHRDIKNHTYSRAWVPVEAPSGTVDKEPVAIERPPNADR